MLFKLTLPGTTNNLPNASDHHHDRYDAELHLVHIADDGCIAVIGILYHLGHPDPLIAKVIKLIYDRLVHLPNMVHSEKLNLLIDVGVPLIASLTSKQRPFNIFPSAKSVFVVVAWRQQQFGD